jgi:cytochrome c-type biogenesis protein CcmH/NrfF
LLLGIVVMIVMARRKAELAPAQPLSAAEEARVEDLLRGQGTS